MSTPPTNEPPSGFDYPPTNPASQQHDHGRPSPRNGLAITSLVLGILAIPLGFFSIPGIALGILAVIFGGIGIARARDRVSNKGMAIAGLATGIVGIGIGTFVFIAALRIASDCQDVYGPDMTDEQLSTCVEDSVTG